MHESKKKGFPAVCQGGKGMFVVIAESSGLTVMFLIIVRVEDWVIC